MAFKATSLKYNAKYKTLYVNEGTFLEFEGIYKIVNDSKAVFSGKISHVNLHIVDKETGIIVDKLADPVTFDIFLKETKITIKDKEYTFFPFDSGLLIVEYLHHLGIKENTPFKGTLDFNLPSNWLEIFGNGIDDFGNTISKDSLFKLVAERSPVTVIESLSFDIPGTEVKTYQKSGFNEYQRLSDRYRFLSEKLGIENGTPNLYQLCECLDDLISKYEDTVDVNQLLTILMSK